MHFFVSLLLFVSLHLVEADDEERLWRKWKSENPDQHIGRGDEDMRRGIFHDTLSFVESHNSKLENNEVSYEVSLNKFAASSPEELQKTRLGLVANLSVPNVPGPSFDVPLLQAPIKIANSIDWRTKGAVTPVKDQGKCGACWAFSTTGAIEGHTFLKTKKLVSLSEQNLMDCSWNLGNAGCNGGLMNPAFISVQRAGGLNTAAQYPYTARDSRVCKFNKATSTSPIMTYRSVASRNETALMEAVNIGPVSIAIQVVSSFYYYKSGIYSDVSCGQNLNHAMLLVGYGSDSSGKYWLAKNSWGNWWGEKGYVRIARGSNMCGIANLASYPIV